MATTLTTEQALDWVVAEPRTAKLGTVTKDGFPHVAPVWVARDGGRLVFNTAATSVKGRSLVRDGRVSMCFDDEAPPFGFVTIQGTAELTEDPTQVAHWATIIAGRYMGEDLAEQYGRRNGVPGELLVTVTPVRVIGQLRVAD